jgi:hypothetical protein
VQEQVLLALQLLLALLQLHAERILLQGLLILLLVLFIMMSSLLMAGLALRSRCPSFPHLAPMLLLLLSHWRWVLPLVGMQACLNIQLTIVCHH